MDEPPTYDALLLVSFGGPERAEDVMPFLRRVVSGRGVPDERLKVVAEHYYAMGGRSPINDECRALLAALEPELRAHGIELPVYWGNRNWDPMLEDTLRKMRDDGVRDALGLVTSAFSSYSGCRQYREAIERARLAVGEGAPRVHKMRGFYNHPGFVETMVERVDDAKATLSSSEGARLIFTAHSIPLAMASGCAYEAQLADTCARVARGAGFESHEIAYQSRSGSPRVPWLEPDILDRLRELAADGVARAVVVPIGFVSDHMEVVWDLDREARELADELGMEMARAKTAGAHPCFVAMLRELVRERTEGLQDRPALGARGPLPDVCPVDCCTYEPPSRGGASKRG